MSVAPRVLRVDPNAPDLLVIEEGAAMLRAGKLVAFPTETVYGLGANGLDEAAVARIFVAKNRPISHPLILHVLGREDAAALARDGLDARALAIADAFWPGPLTLVVKKSARVPDEITGGGNTVALRAPSHPVARALIRVLGSPIAAPSANRYQSISPTLAAHVVKSLGAAVDLVIDGGACESGVESTVLDLTGARARVLRPGGISLEALRRVIGEVDFEANATAPESGGSPHASPGLDEKHYAPRAKLVFVDDESQAIEILHAHAHERVGAIFFTHEIQRSENMQYAYIERLPANPAGFARGLYAALHRVDDANVDLIVCIRAPKGDAWAAVADRLTRASGGRDAR